LNENIKIADDKKAPSKKDLVQGEDYYINEQGNWVFTAKYHLRRGYCCNNGCIHCPYGYHEIKNWV
jgi:hypothetical protein